MSCITKMITYNKSNDDIVTIDYTMTAFPELQRKRLRRFEGFSDRLMTFAETHWAS